jgi:hypothetical protein
LIPAFQPFLFVAKSPVNAGRNVDEFDELVRPDLDTGALGTDGCVVGTGAPVGKLVLSTEGGETADDVTPDWVRVGVAGALTGLEAVGLSETFCQSLDAE